MKTVILDLEGRYYPGDFVLVSHVSRGGGRNSAKHRVQDAIDGEDMAELMAQAINGGASEWNSGQFQASADGAQLMIMCNEQAANVEIVGSVESKTGVRNFAVVVL